MKPPLASIERDPDALYAFNQEQIKVVRAEGTEAKQCFNTQSHQTVALSVAILGVGLKFVTDLKGADINWYTVAFTVAAPIFLCLFSINVGCHKYNTANRALGYEIHLSRIIEYSERNRAMPGIERELRRIGWEQAMFAWRIVQPVIFDFLYYQNRWLGICCPRLERGASMAAEKRYILAQLSEKRKGAPQTPPEGAAEIAARAEETFASRREAIRRYPWYDSRLLLSRLAEEADILGQHGLTRAAGDHAQFHPGSYLNKSMQMLFIMIGLCCFLLTVSIWKIWESPGSGPPAAKSDVAGPYFATVIGAALFLYTVASCVRCYRRARVLESGLLSIQTSAFVWRIVCLAHLCAIARMTEMNEQRADDSPQIYNKYTLHLGAVSCDLRNNLHDVHEWLRKTERFLNGRWERDAALGIVRTAMARAEAAFAPNL